MSSTPGLVRHQGHHPGSSDTGNARGRQRFCSQSLFYGPLRKNRVDPTRLKHHPVRAAMTGEIRQIPTAGYAAAGTPGAQQYVLMKHSRYLLRSRPENNGKDGRTALITLSTTNDRLWFRTPAQNHWRPGRGTSVAMNPLVLSGRPREKLSAWARQMRREFEAERDLSQPENG